MTKIINIITLGCAKNIVDSEKFAFQLENNNYKVYHNSNNSKCNIVCINTCAFIDSAKEESINTILDYVRIKNKNLKIIVFGCLAARYYEELKKEIPEIDAMIKNYDINLLIKAVNKDIKIIDENNRKFIDNKHFAYLKIAEGCPRKCAFCAIPNFKGKYVSRDFDDIIDEAKALAQQGVKEIIIIAQDISYYGYDKYKKFLLPNLIQKISEIDQIKWIRLHYLYPYNFTDELIDIIANNNKVCKYVDIPLQHISDKILTAMNRKISKIEIENLLLKLKNRIPNLSIRTTLMLGFPGETKKEFQELVEFVEKYKFDRLGVFQYSHQDNTIAAKKYKDSIAKKTKENRAEKIMKIQQEISYELNEKKINKTFNVIIDSKENDYYIARTEFDSPEIDNDVIINTNEQLNIGEFYQVKIIDNLDFTLIAKKE